MTPEELDKLAEEAATKFYWDYGSDPRPAIRSAISQALSLQRESVIETQLDAQRYRYLRDEETSEWIADRLTLRLPEDWDSFIDKRRETAIRALKG